MNVVAISGEVVSNAQVKGKPGFSVVLFQVKNTVGFGERAKVSVLNIKKMGKSAGNIAKYLTAGKKVNITGQLVMETYQSNGATKSYAVIQAQSVDLGYDDKKREAPDTGNDFDPDAQQSPAEGTQDSNEPDYFG